MNSPTSPDSSPMFVDRRNPATAAAPAGRERRQFANSYDQLSAEARELAIAIDQYKLDNRRRFITYEEMLTVIHSLGYQKHGGEPVTRPQ
jgi:hypothetical protein